MSQERNRTLDMSEKSVFYRPSRESPAGTATDRARGNLPTGTPEGDESVFSLRYKQETPKVKEFQTTTWLWIMIIPIVVWLVIVLLMPTFVVSSSDEKRLDQNSVLLWTLIISLIIWILFFGFAKCKTC